jgi:hypothetical protein
MLNGWRFIVCFIHEDSIHRKRNKLHLLIIILKGNMQLALIKSFHKGEITLSR